MTQTFRDEIVRQCLRDLGEHFRTMDLSQHADMLAGHPEQSSHTQYNAWVGKYLSQQCPHVRRAEARSNARGALWRNRLSRCSPPSPAPVHHDDAPATMGMNGAAIDLGPQNPRDKPFTARMRRHQSWYRSAVLRLPAGTGPQPQSSRILGNMLQANDAQLGRNFLTPEIHEVARARLRHGGRSVEPFRLLHNMLSSQPMCFNLFGPLVHDAALATRLLQCIPSLQVERVLSIQLEHAPEPAREYLADGTSFDAFIEYQHRDGRRAFVGIETKLTEPFSQNVHDTPAYRRWMSGPTSPWRREAEASASAIAHNQLWRDHLLAVALRDHPAQRYAHGALVLVRHPLDQSCASIVAGYERLLTEGDETFIDQPLDQLIESWQAAIANDRHHPWIASFRQRYLALDQSEEAL